ncbi:uncharacterized protein LOC115949803 [Quercus lobata]|uniref:uncharacterized protein LOC115949803 n=1 Tax=Quercus lobata TaxID=97700 RepID=UPI001246AFA1|nr:uncharacterized protein LOC115949803 [Quercus lobata]
MGRHCFYVYYDGEQYFHDLHGLSYKGESVKQKFIELKWGTHLRKMHRKIMEALRLDKESHKISIVYRAPQILVSTQVVYNSNPLGCDADVDMMWAVIKRTPQFIASDLYVTVEAVGFHGSASSQHASGVEEPHSLSVDVHPPFAYATPFPYNNQPCSAVDHLDNTKCRDVYEEFIDTDGPVDDAEVLDVPLIENNEEDCLTTVPIPEWFTSNTWDNINDPSPALGTGHLTSWHKGDHPARGMLFKNKASVQYVLTLYSVEHNKQYKVIKSDTNRLVVRCKNEACLWSIRANCSKKHGMWVISTCKGPHSCSSLQLPTDGRMMDSKFISIALEKYVREDLTRKVRDLRSMLHARHGHDVTMYKVWEAKQKAVARIYGDFDESYAELPRFLAALSDADPDTVTTLKCDPHVPGTCIFNSAFWAFGPCIRGFRHCRPVISIDATHLYGKYKGKLLIAMATDGNNEVYPLAFAVVESESTETWGWFLACLLTYVTDRTNLCIISDRHRGIQSCFDDTTRGYLQPPLTHHRYCLRHLVSNVNTNFNSVPLKNLVWNAATANQVRKFENTMDCIKNVNPAAYDYLKEVNQEKWTLVHDHGHRYGAMTTNLSECFNGVLKGARSLPITAMVKFTFYKVNSYFDECRNKTLEKLEEGQVWCKYAYDKFEENQEKVKLHIVRRMSAQQRLYTVEIQSSLLNTGGGDHTHRVSLIDMTCTCGKWEANKIPCSHLIAVCAKHNHDATEYMHHFYRLEERYHSYEPIFQPLKDRLEWPEPAERRTVMPNQRLIREKGRPKSTRIRNEMDDEDRELPTSLWIENGPKLKCGLSRQEGHNRRTCPTRNVVSTSHGAM